MEIYKEKRTFSTITGIKGTEFDLSPQMKSFYDYAVLWSHSSVELLWMNPDFMKDFLGEETIVELIDNDFGKDGILSNFDSAETDYFLFAIDDLQVPFERAYFLFQPGDVEPKVIEAGSEVVLCEDLADYVKMWRRIILSRQSTA